MFVPSEIILETERLVMTEFSVNIAEKLYALNADEEVLRFTGDKAFASVEASKKFIVNYSNYKDHGFGRWSVWTKENSEWIGWCGLRKNEDGLTDIGFRFNRQHWNQGFATESSKACLKYAFQTLELDQVIARSNSANLASIKVINKLSLSHWKTEIDSEMGETRYFRISREKYISDQF